MKEVSSLDAPASFSPHEAMCWKSGYNQAQDALAARLIAAEKLLHEADEVIEILNGDLGSESAQTMLDAIEQHWQTYPEPLE
jgi:hypothetical protein